MTKGWLVTLIAASGVGKSIMLVNQALDFAIRYNERVLFITDENSHETIMRYMHCAFFGINHHKVVDREINLPIFLRGLGEEERKEYNRVFSLIDVIELPDIPLNEVKDICNNASSNGSPYTFVIVDSFDEIGKSGKLSTIERYESNGIAVETMAKDLDIVLVLTTQMETEIAKSKVSIEDLTLYCNYSSKTLPKKSFFVGVIHQKYIRGGQDEGNRVLDSGLYFRVLKSRSGGLGILTKLNPQFDCVRLLGGETKDGVSDFY